MTGRDPVDHPGGIPYRLIAEACQPAINTTDLGAIFEEHHICRNLSVWQHSNAVSLLSVRISSCMMTCLILSCSKLEASAVRSLINLILPLSIIKLAR